MIIPLSNIAIVILSFIFNFINLPLCFENKATVYPSLLTQFVKIRISD
jgi:hypothetical protein